MPQNPDKSRRVSRSDNWPMYYGGWRPRSRWTRALAWAFSVTKAYSATVRAGFSISNDVARDGARLRG